jgi:hypothetical protein
LKLYLAEVNRNFGIRAIRQKYAIDAKGELLDLYGIKAIVLGLGRRELDKFKEDGGESLKKTIKEGICFYWRVIDGLNTNFSLPKSSLWMMISALLGRERLFPLYEIAIAEQYRSFSLEISYWFYLDLGKTADISSKSYNILYYHRQSTERYGTTFEPKFNSSFLGIRSH